MSFDTWRKGTTATFIVIGVTILLLGYRVTRLESSLTEQAGIIKHLQEQLNTDHNANATLQRQVNAIPSLLNADRIASEPGGWEITGYRGPDQSYTHLRGMQQPQHRVWMNTLVLTNEVGSRNIAMGRRVKFHLARDWQVRCQYPDNNTDPTMLLNAVQANQ